MPETDSAQPMPLKVNQHKWTTKVNIAVVIGVVVVFLVGAGYAIYAALHPDEVQQEQHEEVKPPSRGS